LILILSPSRGRGGIAARIAFAVFEYLAICEPVKCARPFVFGLPKLIVAPLGRLLLRALNQILWRENDKLILADNAGQGEALANRFFDNTRSDCFSVHIAHGQDLAKPELPRGCGSGGFHLTSFL
jgi:hypothetical protein